MPSTPDDPTTESLEGAAATILAMRAVAYSTRDYICLAIKNLMDAITEDDIEAVLLEYMGDLDAEQRARLLDKLHAYHRERWSTEQMAARAAREG